DLDIALSDAFNGTMNLFHNATFDSASPWVLATGGVLNADNGCQAGGLPLFDIPAGVSTIAGGAFTQSGGTINLVDADGTLQFNAPFNMTGGTFIANGHVIFNADATIG